MCRASLELRRIHFLDHARIGSEGARGWCFRKGGDFVDRQAEFALLRAEETGVGVSRKRQFLKGCMSVNTTFAS